MSTELKTFRASFKATDPGVDGADSGIVEALVSVFNNVDYGGDRVMPGAFTESLKEWAASGDPIPFIWSHAWSNPDAHIGYVVDAKETTDGLWLKAQLDLDRPFAAQVFHLLKSRRVREFSFGYEVVKSTVVEEPVPGYPDVTERIRELNQLEIFEAGPTLLGMNPDTQLIQAASRPDPTTAPPAPPVKTEPAPGDTDHNMNPAALVGLLTKTRHLGDTQ